MPTVGYASSFRTNPVCVLQFSGDGQTWTNMPAAQTEYPGGTVKRRKIDLSAFREVCLAVTLSVAGATGSKVGLQYSLDNSTWVYLDGSADGNLVAQTPQIAVDSTTPALSSWVTIDPAARTVVFLRAVGIGGDGAIDPNFQTLQGHFR